MFKLTVAFPRVPVGTVKEPGLIAKAKSVGALTTMLTVTVWTRELLVAVTVTSYVPGAVEEFVVIVKLDCAELADDKLTVAGFSVEMRPDLELAERVILPEKLSRLVRVRT